MPCDQRRETPRLFFASILATCAWAGSAGASPLHAEALVDPAPAGVPGAPLPRLELTHPLTPAPDQWPLPEASSRATAPDTPAWGEPASWENPIGTTVSLRPPLDANEPTPSAAASASTPPPAIDDRSGWARWNSSLWGVTATVLTFDAVLVAAFTLLPTELTGWHEPEFNGLNKNFTEGPRVDNDRFVFNYIAHPLAGSEYYLIARNRDANWWQSLAYSAFMSAAFEFLIESTYEQASWQDLWITPVSGAFFGELRWQVKKALENPYTGKPVGTFNKILYVVIDPFDAVYKL